jgi:hypothetical protein
MDLLKIEVHKDAASVIPKEVTRDEAATLAANFRVTVNTPDGKVEFAEFNEAHPADEDDKEDEAKVVASLLKRRDMSKTAFKKLPADQRERMLLEETTLMANEAEAKA